MAISLIKRFVQLEAAGGVVLLLATLLALALANSPLSAAVQNWLHPLHFWINDGLMTVFFLLVGLEIKRETLTGHLANAQQRRLPVVAACGGVIMPALIYCAITLPYPELHRGWAIPTATDIAFALCVMQLLGKNVSHSLKITLLTLAILDDLLAVLIIAIFYTATLNLWMLAAAACLILALQMLNRLHIHHLLPYLALGGVLWGVVLQSGIHATIAGVALAFCIPAQPAARLQSALHPWVAFGIMPLFAFSNAGLSLADFSWAHMGEPLTLAILLGLIFGKPLGVLIATGLAVKAGYCRIPTGTTSIQYAGMAVLTGIGFTMSLFIGGLAFSGADYQQALRLGVLAGSLVSAILGYWLLKGFGQTNAALQHKT